MNGVEYLTLTGDDVLKMAAKIESLGLSIPHPQLSVIEVAVVEGELAGFGCSQMMFHAEPLEVLPKYRGMGIAEELAKRVMRGIEEAHGKVVLSVATNQHAEKLCEAQGMREVPGKLYVKVLSE